jgi:hypothetical protein
MAAPKQGKPRYFAFVQMSKPVGYDCLRVDYEALL